MSGEWQTVQVEKMSTTPVIMMRWEHNVAPTHVKDAFRRISEILSESAESLYVVVDIRANPNFPLSSTLTGAIFGPFRDPKLKEWLIIGSNPVAHIIDRTLSKVTGRSNVKWFETLAQVNQYLQQASEQQSIEISA